MSERTYTTPAPVPTASQPGGLTTRAQPTHPHPPIDWRYQTEVIVYPRRNAQVLSPDTASPPLPYTPASAPIVRPAADPSARSPPQHVAAPPAGAAPSGEVDPNKCPHCNYTSTRAPDRRRHAETHTGDSTPPRWFCNGLRPAEARKRGINIKGMPVYIIQAQKRVGGCLMAFSRRDAMLRHRRTSGGQCFGK